MSPPNRLELTEYEPVYFPPDKIPYAAGQTLKTSFGPQVEVQFPNPLTGQAWRLTAQGWVGYLPLSQDLQLVLKPKVVLHNLFRMLEYAYRLNFDLLPGLILCQSLAEFYERLADILAKRVLERGRKGFYRAYLARYDQLPYVRGRLNLAQSVQNPAHVRLACRYETHTADVEDNQIIAWTLYRIARGGRCGEGVLPHIRRAFRALQNTVALVPHQPQACQNRTYHRLNQDYQPLHALCRFFLEHDGPGHRSGQQQMVPFLINMESLYELFVAEWLKWNLPTGYTLQAQETAGNESVSAFIDLVLYNLATGQPEMVLDTKYKAPDKPANADIYQVVAYAEAKGCRQAVLIYPTQLPSPIDTMWGKIRVRSLTFALNDNLEEAGQSFLQRLFGSVHSY